MAEFSIGEKTYRTAKLNARQQWNVTRRLAPLMAAAGDMLKLLSPDAAMADGTPPSDYFAAMKPLADAMSSLSDEDSDYILNTCMKATMRKSGERWVPIITGDQLLFEDIDMAAMLRTAQEVLQESLGGFFAGLPGLSRSQETAPTSN